MKLKHVFFSSLILSVGFTACTNEDITEVVASVNTDDAISLGEGYVISGTKYTATPATRSIFEVTEGVLTPYWEESDVIGAAWYSLVPQDGIDDEGKVTKCQEPNLSYCFASNTDFNYLEQVGSDMSNAKFSANTNVMAGAYVLYYPFDKNITTVSNEITVKREFPVDVNLAEGHEFDAINKGMFSYGEAAFIPGGRQTGYFKLRQVPVIYRLNFGAKGLNLVGLGGTLTIDKVIMEASKGGQSVLATEGKVTPNAVTAADYNNYIAYIKGEENGKELPKATYTSTSTTTTEHYTINVLGGDQAAYQITELDKATEGSIVFSALPFTDAADKITFKIITDKGIILSEEITDADVLKIFNDANAADAETADKLIQQEIFVDTQTDDNTIYTADQFMAQWEAAIKANDTKTLTIADPIILEDLTLAIGEKTQANITIESTDGAKISVKGIDLQSGTLTFKGGDVVVAEDIKTNGDATLNVSGKLTAGDMNLGGKAELGEVEMKTLYVQASGVVTLALPEDAEKSGEITVNKDGQLTLTAGSISSINNLGGTLTLKGEVTNTGIFEGTVKTTGGKFINKKGATATFTSSTNAAIVNEAGATINVEEGATLTMASGSENAGTINVKVGTLSLSAANFEQGEDDARIYVEEKGKVTGTVAINNGWLVLNHKDATVAATVTGNKAFSVKKAEDLNVSLSNTYYFIDADLKITSETNLPWNTYINANQTLGAALNTSYNLDINGDITLSGNGSLSVNGGATLSIDGTLTVGKDVTVSIANITKADLMKINAADPTKVKVTNAK